MNQSNRTVSPLILLPFEEVTLYSCLGSSDLQLVTHWFPDNRRFAASTYSACAYTFSLCLPFFPLAFEKVGKNIPDKEGMLLAQGPRKSKVIR